MSAAELGGGLVIELGGGLVPELLEEPVLGGGAAEGLVFKAVFNLRHLRVVVPSSTPVTFSLKPASCPAALAALAAAMAISFPSVSR
jgi:hypothetical protein